jgi:hypothetical protein
VSLAIGPFDIAAALLAAAGAAKVLAPHDTTTALRAARLPASEVTVRIGGLAEAAVGVAAIATGGAIAAVLVAVSYAGFAAFVLLALRRDTPLASCGCFGKDDTPPTRLHLVLDLGAVAAAVAVVVDPGPGLAGVLRDQPLGGVPFLTLVLAGAALAYLALTSLPRVLALVGPRGER